MDRYVDPTEQLVTEIFVRDIKRSTAFYRRLGFELVRDDGDFVELTWEGHLLFLDERPEIGPVPDTTQANVRVMVPDVDRYWELAAEMGAGVLAPIQDKSYGLRDFAIADPDGFAVRFATRLEDLGEGSHRHA
ncbi:MAG: VOC family protein [Chloroflexota bacterium]|nr:VOC family protein [Chloroflexota bacterium]